MRFQEPPIVPSVGKVWGKTTLFEVADLCSFLLLVLKVLWRPARRSYQGINEEIIWVSIGMGITIAILITIALCYIMREKCIQRREYYISA
ncbi:hypothetical protein RI129_010112 [Pyrocoelia pectoralis]|uniref:Uncharacterized protein n=1 Tax=Pyrocoelia pectoralis TaxID=417401 RepID=A0AAN7V3Q9_9COLE